MITSLDRPARICFSVDLSPRVYFPDLMTSESLELMLSAPFLDFLMAAAVGAIFLQNHQVSQNTLFSSPAAATTAQ